MKLGIPQVNKGGKDFPKVVKQTEALESGMYKCVFKRFITLGMHEDTFNEGKVKFYTKIGFEAVENMAGDKIGDFVKEYDNGDKDVGPTMLFRDIPLADELHHKSTAFSYAKALKPDVPTVAKGKDKEHHYIVGFDWEAHLDTTVLVQVERVKAKESGNLYNKIVNVMPLGAPLESKSDKVFFNLYNEEHKDVFDGLDGFTKKQIRESLTVAGEPNVIYRDEQKEDAGEKEDAPKQNEEPPVDFDDDIPF